MLYGDSNRARKRNERRGGGTEVAWTKEREPVGPTCRRCDAPITPEDTICPSCARPTIFMSFEERTRWEVEQYRAYKERDEATA